MKVLLENFVMHCRFTSCRAGTVNWVPLTQWSTGRRRRCTNLYSQTIYRKQRVFTIYVGYSFPSHSALFQWTWPQNVLQK